MSKEIVKIHGQTRHVKTMRGFGRCSVAAEVGSDDAVLHGEGGNVSSEYFR